MPVGSRSNVPFCDCNIRWQIPFDEPGRQDPGRFGDGLRRAVYNFMHGVGLDSDVRTWFDFPMPRASKKKN